MISNIIVVGTALFFISDLIFSKRLRNSQGWIATVTPLASIIGSGFLVSAPLLSMTVGDYAVFAMGGLIILAYFIGEAIRFNIRYLEPILKKPDKQKTIVKLEDTSRIVLICAYFISVTYYLVLLGAFLLRGAGIQDLLLGKIITTGILGFIGFVGWWRGLHMLESIEKYAVSINISIIVSFIFGLIYLNSEMLVGGSWHLLSQEPVINIHSMQVVLGLLICVQGFETSRFLGSAYSADKRIKTMKYAQIISAIVYISFFGLSAVIFDEGFSGHGATAIIEISSQVAFVLPVMLIIAAVSSQFSASVADNVGAGGLVAEVTRKKVSLKMAYLLIAIIAIGITWTANIYEIICIASRAFALYYAFQCLSASILVFKMRDVSYRAVYMLLFPLMTVVCFIVVIFGLPAGG